MNFQVSFRHMESSLALQRYAERKLKTQILKFDPKIVNVHVTMEQERLDNVVHCWVIGSDGHYYNVHERAQHDFYQVIDKMARKLAMQMRRQKEAAKSRSRQWHDYLRLNNFDALGEVFEEVAPAEE